MRNILILKKTLLIVLFISCIFLQHICSCPADAIQAAKAQAHHSLSSDSISLSDLCTDCGHTHTCCKSKKLEVLESTGVPFSITADDLVSLLLTIASIGPPAQSNLAIEPRDQYVLRDKPKLYLMKMSFLI